MADLFAVRCYRQVGRKRAPNFGEDMRRAVYPVFLKYERVKVHMILLHSLASAALTAHVFCAAHGKGAALLSALTAVPTADAHKCPAKGVWSSAPFPLEPESPSCCR